MAHLFSGRLPAQALKRTTAVVDNISAAEGNWGASRAAVVVTHNRLKLLSGCIEAIMWQTLPPEGIFVVDNASTDGTELWLEELTRRDACVHVIRLAQNRGGAGGFEEGLRSAISAGFDWVWVMDDDAEPDREALEALRSIDPSPRNIYGSVAVSEGANGPEMCWSKAPHGQDSGFDSLPETWEVPAIPFLGLFIHRNLVQDIGYPDSSFFLSGDDMEYCARARRVCARCILARSSRIRHPLPARRHLRILGRVWPVLELPPWKRYYDVRNRIVIARRHYGVRLWTETVPGIILRWLFLLSAPGAGEQSRAFLRGVLDGFTDRMGRRWQPGSAAYGPNRLG
jgi:rhamnopyranosyl-N-acetylglucosaminyl-diphospho-decaprenol beta-1,3/1,4-galactofuranosyltransferase